MANPPYSILHEIIGRVQELSDAVSPLNNQRNNSGGSAVSQASARESTNNQTGSSMHTVQEEVSRAFNRPSSVPQVRAHTTPLERSSQNSGPLFGLRRNFQGRHGGSKPKKPKQPTGPFLRDVVLLTGPQDRIVPRQGVRIWLSEHGHILSGFEFYKEWNACQVELAIKEAFEDKISPLTDFEILMSVHSSLVVPTLAPGQNGLSGVMIHRIFKGKPVYVRPTTEIVDQNRVPWSSLRDRSTGEDFDDLHEHETNFQSFTSYVEQVTEPDGIHPTNSPSAHSSHPLQIQEINPAHVQPADPPQEQLFTATLDPTLPPQSCPNLEIVENALELDDDILEHKSIKVNRGQIRDQVVEIFQDSCILKYHLHVTIIGDNGEAEKGNGRGVMLDMLTNFWQHVFDSLTVGTHEKVPSIRHDYQKNHWQAIARVLVYGYAREKYFPIRLSSAFICAVLFGEESVSDDFLLQSFQLYVSFEERDTLVAALSGNINPDDEDLLDVLSSYKCKRLVTMDNISQTINELAHQEILQKPKYIIDCFSSIVAALKVFGPFQSVDCLKEMYESKKPTPRRIVKLLQANPSTEAEHTCLDHLKRYIRSLEGSGVNQFLAFITGSDVIVHECITVSFLEHVGTEKRPIAHTCGPVLELPSTYDSYNELAEQFNYIIKNTITWGFTIA